MSTRLRLSADCLAYPDARLVPVLHQRCETYLGDVLRIEVEQSVRCVILLAHLCQRIDIAQLMKQFLVGLVLDSLNNLLQLQLLECYCVAIVFDECYLCHVVAIIRFCLRSYNIFL